MNITTKDVGSTWGVHERGRCGGRGYGRGQGEGEDGQLVEKGRGDRHSRLRDWVAGTRMQEESKSMKAVDGKGEGQGRSRGRRARECLEGWQG